MESDDGDRLCRLRCSVGAPTRRISGHSFAGPRRLRMACAALIGHDDTARAVAGDPPFLTMEPSRTCRKPKQSASCAIDDTAIIATTHISSWLKPWSVGRCATALRVSCSGLGQ